MSLTRTLSSSILDHTIPPLGTLRRGHTLLSDIQTHAAWASNLKFHHLPGLRTKEDRIRVPHLTVQRAILLTSTMGKAIEGVPFVASTCECARMVDTAVVTGPIQRAFIHICNCKGRGDLKPPLGKHSENKFITTPVMRKTT